MANPYTLAYIGKDYQDTCQCKNFFWYLDHFCRRGSEDRFSPGILGLTLVPMVGGLPRTDFDVTHNTAEPAVVFRVV